MLRLGSILRSISVHCAELVHRVPLSTSACQHCTPRSELPKPSRDAEFFPETDSRLISVASITHRILPAHHCLATAIATDTHPPHLNVVRQSPLRTSPAK